MMITPLNTKGFVAFGKKCYDTFPFWRYQKQTRLKAGQSTAFCTLSVFVFVGQANGKEADRQNKDSKAVTQFRVLYQAFVGAFNIMVENKDSFLGKWQESLGSENLLVRYRAGQLIRIITGAVVVTEFDVDVYFSMVEKMTICDGGRLIVSLLDGTSVECEFE